MGKKGHFTQKQKLDILDSGDTKLNYLGILRGAK